MRDKLIEHFKIQDELNKKLVGEDWKRKIKDEYLFMAILDECAELGRSSGFKWWTVQKPDWDNAKIEVVDIWHFLLTFYIKNTNSDLYDLIIDYLIKGFNYSEKYANKLTIEEMKLRIFNNIDLMLYHLNERFVKETPYFFGEIIGYLFNNLGEFDELYKAKVKLNLERKKKGYDKDENRKYVDGREDNEILIEKIKGGIKKVNLLEETLEILKEIGKTPEDIDWIGSEDGEYVSSWKEFTKLADKELGDLKVVINGAGAAGTAIAELLLCTGQDEDVDQSCL